MPETAAQARHDAQLDLPPPMRSGQVVQHKRRYVVTMAAAVPTPQSGLDTTWAAREVQRFLSLHDQHLSRVRIGYSDPDQNLVDSLLGSQELLDRILPVVLPAWIPPDPDLFYGVRWETYRSAAARALPFLDRAKELEERLGGAPTLNATRMHPWSWEGAQSMWQSQHYRQGVVDALKKVNAEAQNKTGRHDLSETKLFKELFSLRPPALSEPRLRLRDDEGTDTFRSAHIGAMALAEGLFAGIRNVVSHTHHEDEGDEQRALEQLAAVSVLARWVDEAWVVTVP